MLTRKTIEKLWEDAHPRYRWDLLSMRERECAERFARLVEDTEEADEQRRIDDRERLRDEEAVLDTQVWEEDIGRHMR